MLRRMHKGMGLLLLMLLMGTSLSGCGMLGGSGGSPYPSNRNHDRTPAFVLTAERLADDYASNRLVADARYKNKYLLITGVVDRVATDRLGELSVRLEGLPEPKGDARLIMEVNCQFPAEERAKAGELKPGQLVKIRGRCDGESTTMYVDVVDCELMEAGPDPAIAVTAEQLTREYAENRAEADAKYNGRHLLIEGVFLEVSEAELRSVAVLKGHDETSERPLRVKAAFHQDQKDAFAKLIKGERVKVRGQCTGKGGDEISISFALLVKK